MVTTRVTRRTYLPVMVDASGILVSVKTNWAIFGTDGVDIEEPLGRSHSQPSGLSRGPARGASPVLPL